jgi:serine/threonine protein kinase
MPKESPKSFVRKKFLLPRTKRNERLKHIQQEVDILKSLTHIHIVRCLGTYEDAIQVNRPTSYCLLMSPVGNADLKAFLDDTPHEPIDDRTVRFGWVQQWFICLCSALEYMHSQGVRHQDIKPSNIVHRGASIYLTDFSSSSRFIVGQTTSTESPFGCTAMYAAPEVAAKYLEDGTLQKHGRGSDIFALGCVFCEMLTVLAGSSVSSLHNYLVRDGAENRAENGSLLYSRKVTSINQWFQKLDQDGLPFVQIYHRCIKPMMRLNREIRSDAKTAQQNFIGQEVLRKGSTECACIAIL